MPAPERFSFVIDKEDTQRVAILDEKERSYGQKERIREAVAKRTPLDLGLRDKNSGMEFEVGNIFIDGDVLLLRMTLTNRTQIGYTTDFMRFYIQDAKIRKKRRCSSSSRTSCSLSIIRKRYRRMRAGHSLWP